MITKATSPLSSVVLKQRELRLLITLEKLNALIHSQILTIKQFSSLSLYLQNTIVLDYLQNYCIWLFIYKKLLSFDKIIHFHVSNRHFQVCQKKNDTILFCRRNKPNKVLLMHFKQWSIFNGAIFIHLLQQIVLRLVATKRALKQIKPFLFLLRK